MESVGDPEQARRRETSLTGRRIAELRLDPVDGNFDAVHLREINRRIFQDLPANGFPNVTPGIYRSPIPPGSDWVKERYLTTVTAHYTVAYSQMGDAEQAAIEDTLKEEARPEELRRLKPPEFVARVANLYTTLDYLHPFKDGNSRTLREFSRQLAHDSGYHLEWERIGVYNAGRDMLYVARDQAVNRLALPNVEDESTLRDVNLSLDRLEGNREFPDLLRDIVRPSRAVAFERFEEEIATVKYPELKSVYEGLHNMRAALATRFPADVSSQELYLTAVRAQLVRRLDAGEVLESRGVRAAIRMLDQQLHQRPGPPVISIDLGR